jgi:hypothetical protein
MYFRVGGIKSKVSQTLILEMGELYERDVKDYILSAKQIKIIFVQSSGLICLMEKILPMLFGEVFQVTMHRIRGVLISLSLFLFHLLLY